MAADSHPGWTWPARLLAGVIVLLLLRAGVRAVLLSPPPDDAEALFAAWRAFIESDQPAEGENAADLLWELSSLLDEAESASDPTWTIIAALPPGAHLKAHVTRLRRDLGISQDLSLAWWSGFPSTEPLFALLPERMVCRQLEATEFDARLDRLATAPRAIVDSSHRWTDAAAGPPYVLLLPELGTARRIVRMLALRLRMRLAEGRWADANRDAERIAALSNAVRRMSPSVIGELVHGANAQQIRATLLDGLSAAGAAHDVLAGFARHFEADPPDQSRALHGMQLAFLAEIGSCFENDGDGDGALRSESLVLYDHDGLQPGVLKGIHPGRRWTLRMLDRILASPPAGPGSDDLIASLPRRAFFLRMLAGWSPGASGPAMDRIEQSALHDRALFAAMRYARLHGREPVSTLDLVPDFLPEPLLAPGTTTPWFIVPDPDGRGGRALSVGPPDGPEPPAPARE
ncbi:MAG: hypothetical protein KF817_06105 [Phycisphaeraceae bacterium]|nr:hypothetical protein [Phycisphaeraceae bacterium]